MFISYSHDLEDVMVWRALSRAKVKRGYYIDVGANDSVNASMTKGFYDKGYRGINIEPIRRHFDELQKRRPKDINLQVAVSNVNGVAHFYENESDELSTIIAGLGQSYKTTYSVKEYDVPTRTLTDICTEYRVTEVHFLKIDVEGAEREVLEGLDLRTIRPWIIMAEADKDGESSYRLWEPILVNKNYHFVYSDGSNRFYIADERAELDVHFTRPPNVSDCFTISFKRLFLLHLKSESFGAITLTPIQRLLLSDSFSRVLIAIWKTKRMLKGHGFNIPNL
ncbi:MAG TPA: FkbM family methyltransferase [Acidobacteriaceae bacterium]|nr:FkbM family methyltransferase [Acidobacteriaceae bacterium]